MADRAIGFDAVIGSKSDFNDIQSKLKIVFSRLKSTFDVIKLTRFVRADMIKK